MNACQIWWNLKTHYESIINFNRVQDVDRGSRGMSNGVFLLWSPSHGIHISLSLIFLYSLTRNDSRCRKYWFSLDWRDLASKWVVVLMPHVNSEMIRLSGKVLLSLWRYGNGNPVRWSISKGTHRGRRIAAKMPPDKIR